MYRGYMKKGVVSRSVLSVRRVPGFLRGLGFWGLEFRV